MEGDVNSRFDAMPDRPDWVETVPDEAAVIRLAALFAQQVEAPLVIFLQGDLGAGKTTFARAFVHQLGYVGYVKSPSYGLLESYQVESMNILHLDLYRIEDPEELDFLAIRDLFDEKTVLLVEWPDKGRFHLPEADMRLIFDENREIRTISCCPLSEKGQNLSTSIHKR